MFIFMTALLLIAGLCWYYLEQFYNYWARHNVPHEKPVFFLGNMKGVGKQLHMRDVNARLYQRFKHSAPIAGLYFFIERAVVPLDLDLIKLMLIKDFDKFRDRGAFYNERDDPLTAHLFAIEGEPWRAMRNKLSPTFTSGKMRFMFSTVVEVAERLNHCCDELFKAQPDGVIELKELCARYTTDVIGTVAFGLECNSLADPQAEFRQRGRAVMEETMGNLKIFLMLSQPELARKLRMRLISQESTDFFMNAVESTVEYRLKNKIQRNDFMNLLIELLDKEQKGSAKNAKGLDLSQGLTLKQLAAQAFVFFVAGFDTSATTMSFALYELALNEEIQEKLRSEIERVLEKHHNELTYEAMGEMYYLDQVVAETLRKYPVVLDLFRKCNSRFQVPNTKFVIEAGTRVFIPVYAIHHDPDLYPDPSRFDPERFTPEAVMARHACAYLPFGDGPRNCIGLRFGKMQVKVGLITMLRAFKLKKCDKTEVPLEFCPKSFILSAKNGIHLCLEPLKKE